MSTLRTKDRGCGVELQFKWHRGDRQACYVSPTPHPMAHSLLGTALSTQKRPCRMRQTSNLVQAPPALLEASRWVCGWVCGGAWEFCPPPPR